MYLSSFVTRHSSLVIRHSSFVTCRWGMIEVRGVAKYFGRFSALRDLSVTVREGEFVSLFGRNGAGKTTLLRILAGLTRPSSGDVRIHSSGPRSPQEARGGMGYLSHNTALYGDLTAV